MVNLKGCASQGGQTHLTSTVYMIITPIIAHIEIPCLIFQSRLIRTHSFRKWS